MLNSQLLRRSAWVLIILNVLVGWSILLGWHGHDFAEFYAIGKLARSNPSLLFNESAQRLAESGITHKYLPFLHSPHELLLFVPLSYLPKGWSFAAWTVLNTFFLYLACRVVARLTAIRFKDLLLVAFAAASTMFCYIEGQDCFLILLLTASSLYLVAEKLEFAGGVVLALSLVKPQAGLIIAFAMLINRRWRFTAGFATGSAAIVAASSVIFGPSVFRDLVRLILRSQDPRLIKDMVVVPQSYPTIRGITYLLGLPNSVAVVLSVLAVAFGALCWYRAKSVQVLYSSAILISCLIAFNWHIYDLAIVLIPITFLPASKLSSAAIACFYLLPIPLIFLGGAPLICAPLFPMIWEFYESTRHLSPAGYPDPLVFGIHLRGQNSQALAETIADH